MNHSLNNVTFVTMNIFFYPTFQVNSLDVVFYIYMNAGINTESDSLREFKNRFEHITNLKQLCFDH
jgi:xylose isomerase